MTSEAAEELTGLEQARHDLANVEASFRAIGIILSAALYALGDELEGKRAAEKAAKRAANKAARAHKALALPTPTDGA